MAESNDLVCPRCGSRAGIQRFCEGCGLNLALQNELPTAEQFAAGEREQEWLAQQAELETARPRRETVLAEEAEQRREQFEAERQANLAAATDEAADRQAALGPSGPDAVRDTADTDPPPGEGDAETQVASSLSATPGRSRRRLLRALSGVAIACAGAGTVWLISSNEKPTKTSKNRQVAARTFTVPATLPRTTSTPIAVSLPPAGASADVRIGCGFSGHLTVGPKPRGCFLDWPNLDHAGSAWPRHIKWRGWGSPVVTATAQDRYKTYDPWTNVTLRVFGLRDCGNYRVYTRVRVAYPYGPHTWRTPTCEEIRREQASG